MTDDELKQLLLELLYGLLDDRDAESLRNRIATDAHVAQIFEEVRHTHELLAQAARWKSETSTFQASQTKIGHIAIVDPSFSIPEQLLHSKTSGFSLKSLSFHQDSEKLASPTLKDESDNETGSELFRSAIESPRDEKIYRKNSQKLNDSRLHSKIRKTVSGFKSDSGFPDRASITSNTSKSSVWHQLFPQHQSQNRRRNLNSGSNSGTNLSNKPSIPFKFLLYTQKSLRATQKHLSLIRWQLGTSIILILLVLFGMSLFSFLGQKKILQNQFYENLRIQIAAPPTLERGTHQTIQVAVHDVNNFPRQVPVRFRFFASETDVLLASHTANTDLTGSLTFNLPDTTDFPSSVRVEIITGNRHKETVNTKIPVIDSSDTDQTFAFVPTPMIDRNKGILDYPEGVYLASMSPFSNAMAPGPRQTVSPSDLSKSTTSVPRHVSSFQNTSEQQDGNQGTVVMDETNGAPLSETSQDTGRTASSSISMALKARSEVPRSLHFSNSQAILSTRGIPEISEESPETTSPSSVAEHHKMERDDLRSEGKESDMTEAVTEQETAWEISATEAEDRKSTVSPVAENTIPTPSAVLSGGMDGMSPGVPPEDSTDDAETETITDSLSSNNVDSDNIVADSDNIVPQSLSDWKIEFYPENGSLLSDVENRVWFSIQVQTPNPPVVQGHLEDENGRVILDSIQSDENGLGVFTFVPAFAHQYFFVPELNSELSVAEESLDSVQPPVSQDDSSTGLKANVTEPESPSELSGNAQPDTSVSEQTENTVTGHIGQPTAIRFPLSEVQTENLLWFSADKVIQPGQPLLLKLQAQQEAVPVGIMVSQNGTLLEQFIWNSRLTPSKVRIPLHPAIHGTLTVSFYRCEKSQLEPIVSTTIYRRPEASFSISTKNERTDDHEETISIEVLPKLSCPGKGIMLDRHARYSQQTRLSLLLINQESENELVLAHDDLWKNELSDEKLELLLGTTPASEINELPTPFLFDNIRSLQHEIQSKLQNNEYANPYWMNYLTLYSVIGTISIIIFVTIFVVFQILSFKKYLVILLFSILICVMIYARTSLEKEIETKVSRIVSGYVNNTPQIHNTFPNSPNRKAELGIVSQNEDTQTDSFSIVSGPRSKEQGNLLTFDPEEYGIQIIYWNPSLVTDEKGTAEIKIPSPPSNVRLYLQATDSLGNTGVYTTTIQSE